jgi:hypothetical protein
MMHDNRTLSATGGSADPATVVVSFKNLFPEASEVFLILPLERVAGRAHTQR